jgi:hypothetical protein
MGRFVGALSFVLLMVMALPAWSAAQEKKSSTGTVTAAAADSLTIKAASGDQTFSIDGTTKVVGRGVGSAANKQGGKVAFVDAVKVGARVTVSYHLVGTTMHAAEVRVNGPMKKK